MELEQLKTFISLTNTKNFTRTAEELNVVQSTITSRIKQLEENVGKKLFVRKTRSVEITQAGKTFLPYAKQTIELIQKGIEETRIKPRFNSRLVIGGLNSIWDTPIFDYIHMYYGQQTNTAIRLISGHSNEIIDKIQLGLIDVGFVYSHPRNSSFFVHKVCEEELNLVANVEIAEDIGDIYAKDLINIPFIHYNWGKEFSKWFESEVGNEESLRYRVDDAGIALRCLLKGEGIGFMLGSIIKEYKQNGLLKTVPFKSNHEIPTRSIYIVFQKKKKSKVLSFYEYICSRAL